MSDTLAWIETGVRFRDGSLLDDWEEIYRDETWHWQYDTHALSYSIYKHDGQFWKLYRVRYARPGDKGYVYSYGGQACRMVQVEFTENAVSGHDNCVMGKGAQQWIRTYEFDSRVMKPLTVGEEGGKYGAPYSDIAA